MTGEPEEKKSQWKLLIAGIVVSALVVVGLVVAFSGGDDNTSANPTTSTAQTESTPAVTVAATVETTVASTAAPVTTPVSTPPTTVPQETCDTSTGWCVGITSVEWEIDGTIRAEYTTTGFVPTNSGVEGDYHVHFFWSSIPPDTVGVPGAGPWFVWDLADGDGEYLFDGINVDNLGGSGYVWEDDLCIAIATHQHALAGDIGAAGIGTSYCLPNTPTPTAT